MSNKGTRLPTKDTGVYVLTSSVKKHNGRPDQCFYITYKDSNRKIWEKVGWRSEGISQAKAVECRQNRMLEKRQGSLATPKTRKLTLQEAYSEFYTLHLSTLKEVSRAKIWAEKYILPHLGHRTLNSITPHELEKFKADLASQGLAPQSVKHILGLIRRIYNKAIQWGLYYGPVPTMGIKMPMVDSERLRYLTPKEAQLLLETLKISSVLWHDITLLSLFTGLRPNDIFELKAHQINLDAGYIDVIESKPGTYTAFFTETIRDMLIRRIQESKKSDTELLFPAPLGGQLKNVGRPFHTAVKKCKFNEGVTDDRYKVVFYTLRHTFASWLAQEGVSLQKIAGLMGHATTQMTQRYAKLSRESLKNAINTIKDHTNPESSLDSEKP